MNTPMSPAASMALTISSRGSPSVRPTPISVPGSPPHDPAVGAATMTPIALFTSMIAVMYLVTLLNRSLGRSVLFRCPASIRCACGPRMRSAYSVPASPSSTAFSMMPTSRSILLKMSSSVVLPRTLS